MEAKQQSLRTNETGNLKTGTPGLELTAKEGWNESSLSVTPDQSQTFRIDVCTSPRMKWNCGHMSSATSCLYLRKENIVRKHRNLFGDTPAHWAGKKKKQRMLRCTDTKRGGRTNFKIGATDPLFYYKRYLSMNEWYTSYESEKLRSNLMDWESTLLLTETKSNHNLQLIGTSQTPPHPLTRHRIVKINKINSLNKLALLWFSRLTRQLVDRRQQRIVWCSSADSVCS